MSWKANELQDYFGFRCMKTVQDYSKGNQIRMDMNAPCNRRHGLMVRHHKGQIIDQLWLHPREKALVHDDGIKTKCNHTIAAMPLQESLIPRGDEANHLPRSVNLERGPELFLIYMPIQMFRLESFQRVHSVITERGLSNSNNQECKTMSSLKSKQASHLIRDSNSRQLNLPIGICKS